MLLERRAAGIYTLGNPPDLIEEGDHNGIEIELQSDLQASEFCALAQVNEDFPIAI